MSKVDKKLVYDLGVHKGEDSEFYLKKSFNVIGIEASPSLYSHCNLVFQDYISKEKLKLYNRAIFNKDDEIVNFYENETKSVWNTMDEEWVKRNEEFGTKSVKTSVKSIMLSSIMALEGIPYYLKIDIEGMDSIAIDSLKLVNPKPTYISSEADFLSWKKLYHQLSLLRELGYTKFKIIDQGRIQFQKCPSPPQEGLFVEHQFKSGSSGLFGKELPGNWHGFTFTVAAYYLLWLHFSFVTSRFILFRVLRRILKPLNLLKKKTWYDTHATF